MYSRVVLFKYAGEILTEVMSSVEQSGAKYAALYVSDPFKSIHYPGYRELERFLADDTAKNVSASLKVCDEVCQLKSSLLEGVLVVSLCLCPPRFFYF